MNLRLLAGKAKWIGITLAYFVLNAMISLTFVLTEMKSHFGNDDSAALGLLMIIWLMPVLAIGLAWWPLYASALMRSRKDHGAVRMWIKLGLSYTLGLLGCMSVTPIFSRLPDFQSQFATSAYLFFWIFLSFACLVLGVYVRYWHVSNNGVFSNGRRYKTD
ncbi:MAG TPA: hypothetical protein VMV57_07175 [Terracidiphilus sp.]|nr:hypothetical protein [Terracidiphilus sp.]